MKGVKRQSGAWVQTQTLLAFEAAGAPLDVVTAAQNSIGQDMISDPHCLPPTLVQQDTPAKRLEEAIQLGEGWQLHPFQIREDGTFSTSATTQNRQVTFEGTLTPTQTDITVMTTGIDPQMGKVTTRQRTFAKHSGPCTADMPVTGE
jgi:hypothetical protein